MTHIPFFQQNKIKFGADCDAWAVEITRQAVTGGLLQELSGVDLKILIYIITHMDDTYRVNTTPATISSLLAIDKQNIMETLNHLAKSGIIEMNSTGTRNDKLNLKLNPAGISHRPEEDEEDKSQQQNETTTLQNRELVAALSEYIPPDERQKDIKAEIKKWVTDFEGKMIRELMRRVNKWYNNNKFNQSVENRFYYLMGIIDDWYDKKIFTYSKLKHYDRLYRETRELAAAYGLENWKQVTPAQKNIFQDWITGQNGLTPAVAKFAIREAVRRKKDGQPSLKYIEDNFINPWKEAGIKTVDGARRFLQKGNSPGKNTKTKQDYTGLAGSWDNFSWDINSFQEH